MPASLLSNLDWPELLPFVPVLLVMLGAGAATVTETFLRKPAPAVSAGLALIALATAAACQVALPPPVQAVYPPIAARLGGALFADGLARGIGLVAVGSAAFAVLMAGQTARLGRLRPGEFHGLILLSASGMMLSAAAADYLTLAVALEIISAATCFLAASARDDMRSGEAALKYFILSAFSIAFLLMGTALIYGTTGSLAITPPPDALPGQAGGLPFLRLAGIGLVLMALGFKCGAAPFHLWVPDVYQGAPAAISGYLATGVKAAAIAVVFRLLASGMLVHAEAWKLVWGAAALSMVLGNWIAIVQSSVKRMLAYSAIAHTGYVLVAMTPLADRGEAGAGSAARATVLYLAVYAATTLGAFAVLALRRADGKEIETFDDLRGLYRRSPGSALAMTLCMFSLAGLPPTAGFWAKYVAFSEALHGGMFGLVIIAIAASAVSLYYYLRVVIVMVMQEGREEGLQKSSGLHSAIALSAAAVALMGLLFEPLGTILGLI